MAELKERKMTNDDQGRDLINEKIRSGKSRWLHHQFSALPNQLSCLEVNHTQHAMHVLTIWRPTASKDGQSEELRTEDPSWFRPGFPGVRASIREGTDLRKYGDRQPTSRRRNRLRQNRPRRSRPSRWSWIRPNRWKICRKSLRSSHRRLDGHGGGAHRPSCCRSSCL